MNCKNCGNIKNCDVITTDDKGCCSVCGKDFGLTFSVEINTNKQVIEAIKNLLEILK